MEIEARASAHVDASVERTFGVLTDPARFSEWQGGMEPARLEDAAEPVGVGSRLSSGRTMAGMRIGFTSEVTEWDPPRRMAFAGVRSLLPVRGAFDVDPDGDGAKVTATLRVGVPRLAPVRLGDRAGQVIAEQLEEDLRRLAALVASEARRDRDGPPADLPGFPAGGPGGGNGGPAAPR